MYFKDRVEAGRKLAAKLDHYRTKNTVVLALSESSVLVAAQVARQLHAGMMLYLIRGIELPGETESIAGVSQGGVFRYNDMLSGGQVEEIKTEFRNYIEQERFKKNHDINVLMGIDGEIDKKLLRRKNIILVADALSSGFSLVMAAEFLKTVAIQRLIVAVPVASVPAVDKMHIMADEMHVLGVADNFVSVDHYFDAANHTTVEDALKIMKHISLAWDKPSGAGHNPAGQHHAKQSRSQVLRRK